MKEIQKTKPKYVQGIVQGNENGYAFLITPTCDYFISAADLNSALHKDEVLCQIKEETSKRTTVKVVKIIKRGLNRVVGTYRHGRRNGYVVPDDSKFIKYVDVLSDEFIEQGQKVVVKITKYTNNSVLGVIEEIIGKEYDKETEIKSILIRHGVPLTFSKECIEEAKYVPKTIQKEAITADRIDLRNETIITIDGESAKDFDDAISVEYSNGIYTLGVHIADVSEYVKFNTPIDNDAFERGNSYYYPELVVPMLPEVLSNGICSLNEGVDRLTLSCIAKIDHNGNVLECKIAKSVIKSTYRMTYNKVQAIIDGNIEVQSEYQKILPLINNANNLAKILINKRESEGVVDLGVSEAKITVNNNEIYVEKRPRLFSEQIIEQFMVFANEQVAKYCKNNNLPCVYRIHELPSPEKIEGLQAYLNAVGVNIKLGNVGFGSYILQDVIKAVESTNLESVVKAVMLRSMQKAKYSTIPKGHFGLALKDYCHFTSPIRRYADLTVHRILKARLEGKKVNIYFNQAEETSARASEKERVAQEAEREVENYYKTIYMAKYIGQSFDGVISGVTNFGIFVELENTIEGIIKITSLDGYGYQFDEKHYTLSNKYNTYKLGMPIKISVIGVDFNAKKIEFAIYNKNGKKIKQNSIYNSLPKQNKSKVKIKNKRTKSKKIGKKQKRR